MTTKLIRRTGIALVCVGTVLAPALASAGITPTPFRTGLFGIATGQAVRVSVLNAGEVGGTVNPCFHPDLAGLVVTLAGPAGRVLFESRHKALPTGIGTFTDFAPIPEDGITGPGGAVVRARRVQMHAEVAIELQPIPEDGAPVPNDGKCADDAVARRHARRLLRNVHLTLEVFDVATSRTAFTMPFSAVMFNPQPEPPEPVAVP
jgi:hypothetical protein